MGSLTLIDTALVHCRRVQQTRETCLDVGSRLGSVPGTGRFYVDEIGCQQSPRLINAGLRHRDTVKSSYHKRLSRRDSFVMWRTSLYPKPNTAKFYYKNVPTFRYIQIRNRKILLCSATNRLEHVSMKFPDHPVFDYLVRSESDQECISSEKNFSKSNDDSFGEVVKRRPTGQHFRSPRPEGFWPQPVEFSDRG